MIGRINVVIKGPLPSGRAAEVLVFLRNEPDRVLRLPIQGRVVPPVVVTPSSLMLPRRSADGPVFDASCFVRSVAGHPLEVELASVPDGLKVALEPIEQNPSMCKLVVRVQAGLSCPEPTKLQLGLRARAGEVEAPVAIPIIVTKAD